MTETNRAPGPRSPRPATVEEHSVDERRCLADRVDHERATGTLAGDGIPRLYP